MGVYDEMSDLINDARANGECDSDLCTGMTDLIWRAEDVNLAVNLRVSAQRLRQLAGLGLLGDGPETDGVVREVSDAVRLMESASDLMSTYRAKLAAAQVMAWREGCRADELERENRGLRQADVQGIDRWCEACEFFGSCKVKAKCAAMCVKFHDGVRFDEGEG